jgi:hypothetical protein
LLVEGSRSYASAVGEAGMLLCQHHLITRGFNVAVPVIPDGTDLLAYDRGRVWQIQVKTAEDCATMQAFDLRGSRQRRSRLGPRLRYAYVDAYMFTCLRSRTIWCVPWPFVDGLLRIRMTGLPHLPADILRHQPIKQFPEAVHPCRMQGDRWAPDVEMLPVSTRECVAALMRRGGSHPQAESLKQKGRPKGSAPRQDRRGRVKQSESMRRRRPR